MSRCRLSLAVATDQASQSIATVPDTFGAHTHVTAIFRKLGGSNRVQACLEARWVLENRC
jgi:hypothetical protein